jgi:hypothetical protein
LIVTGGDPLDPDPDPDPGCKYVYMTFGGILTKSPPTEHLVSVRLVRDAEDGRPNDNLAYVELQGI